MEKYRLQLTTASIIAFISLRHLFHELHELMHMLVGRLGCGVWGVRDFNRVNPMVEGCMPNHPFAHLIGLEGPLFNYVMIWVGAILLKKAKSAQQAAWGFALIFASLPMARLITAVFGGGDELGVVSHLVSSAWLARAIVVTAIIALIGYPIKLVYDALNHRFKWLYILGFLFVPMLLEGLVVLGFFNYLYAQGIWAEIWLMGMPKLVVAVLLVDIVVLIFFGRKIKSLLRVCER